MTVSGFCVERSSKLCGFDIQWERIDTLDVSLSSVMIRNVNLCKPRITHPDTLRSVNGALSLLRRLPYKWTQSLANISDIWDGVERLYLVYLDRHFRCSEIVRLTRVAHLFESWWWDRAERRCLRRCWRRSNGYWDRRWRTRWLSVEWSDLRSEGSTWTDPNRNCT